MPGRLTDPGTHAPYFFLATTFGCHARKQVQSRMADLGLIAPAVTSLVGGMCHPCPGLSVKKSAIAGLGLFVKVPVNGPVFWQSARRRGQLRNRSREDTPAFLLPRSLAPSFSPCGWLGTRPWCVDPSLPPQAVRPARRVRGEGHVWI